MDPRLHHRSGRPAAPAHRVPKRRWQAAATVVALAIGMTVLLPSAASAAIGTKVSIEFDGNTVSNYTLGYQQGLQPRGATGTFFVNSGSIGGANAMSWAQLATMAAAGEDIGGKTVNATNLTTDPNPTAQVCNDRAALLQHGLTPIAFAYPSGASNATVQGIVRGCGYGNGRSAGSLSPTGPTYAETIPPANWFSTRAYAPSAVTLTNMQALVTGASTHNGGWVQIVIGRVCSQTLDPNNYTTCSNASGHIELADLNTFLTWMANAGQSGGAPAGATLSTAAAVVTSADTSTPTTTIACNGAACSDTPYSGVVNVTLAATDTGAGIASTHYTTDGSDPTQSSPTYTGAFNVNSATNSVTVKFRSWDYAGNVESTKTQVIQAPADTTPPTTTIACNGSACSSSPYVESVTVSLSATDSGTVAATYYTTDGSTPSTSSPVYSGSFQLNTPATYTVRFFSVDAVGNAEQPKSQQIQVVPAKTTVSLTFDNGASSQYTLGYQQALKPHGARATYFVNSGTVSVGTNIMTWSQLSTLAGDGNDIGGKSVNATNLTTDPNPTAQVCNDRAALIQHGLNPVAFAYPNGANNATVKAIVKNCGYGSGRTAGSLSPTGPTYAEALPPADWYGTRAYAPTGQVTLANMEALVSGAAAHHGGWSQIVIQRVCSQALDPNNYSGCTATGGWIELADLNSFLDWMGNAGQSGGAPAGAVLSTVRDAAISADSVAPVTTIACNGASCSSNAYSSTVYVTLNPTDIGSAVASTHYTTDGTVPSLSSPTYSGQLPITATTTIKFRSWDNAGNVESVNTQVVQVDQPPDSTPPTSSITCDGATCAGSYVGTVTVALSAADNAGGWGVDKTYYTTDGTTPTTSSTIYTAPFTLTTPGTNNVRFFSTDLAGNAEQPNAQQIQVQPYRTVVSLTFDDEYENFYTYLRPMLRAHDMNATIYTITSDAEIPYSCCMSYAQLRTMQSEGDDIGGHGRDHLDLTDPSTTYEQKVADVCNGRQDLLDHGIYDPASYAYPFGKVNATAETIVQSCGYQTARQGGALSLTTTTPGPRYAETLPPQDPYAFRTIDVDAPNPKTLADLQSFVTAASVHGGGWLSMTFHQVCHQGAPDYDTCMGSWSAVDDTVLEQFLDWLGNAGQSGGAPAGVSVQTVRDAVNTPDTTAPSSTALCNGAPCQDTEYSGSVQLRLSATDPGGVGVRRIYYTTDGSTPTASSAVYDTPLTVASTTTVKFLAVDNAGNAEQPNAVTIQVDQTAPTSTISCDDAPCPSGWSGAPVQVALTATDDVGGTGVDKIYYTTDGSTPTTASTVYTGPFTVADTETVSFFAVDNAGNAEQPNAVTIQVDRTAPTSTISCNSAGCSSGWYGDPVQVDLTATDDAGGSGADTIYYTTDGSTPTTSSTLYTGSFTLSSTTTVSFFAVDNVGNAEQPNSVTVQVDLAAPTTTISCDAAPCPTGWHNAAVQVELTATDNAGGSGVAEIYYTTDGSAPTTASTAYAGAFTVTDTATVRFFAVDNAGNAEQPNAVTIQVDRTAPTTTISCNGGPCSSGWYNAPVQVTLAATDSSGGSGANTIYYTTDGSTPTTASTVYTAAFTATGTETVKFFAVDYLGNAEQPNAVTIQVDQIAPTSTVSCNGAPCPTGWYGAPVQVALTATDNAGGSGVDRVYYTTDGSTPTTASTVYAGPFTLSSTTAVRFFAVDVAGNAEQPNAVTIQVDQTAPTSSISCNGAACSSGWYVVTVQVALTATDNPGGSGANRIYYTTNGSTPTTSSTLYTGVFTLSSTTTVKYFALDNAGNAEQPNTVTIQIDQSRPTTTISCNSAACSNGWYRAPVQVTLAATDAGGSGLDRTYYTTDGSTPTTSSTVYAGPFTVSSTTTVKFFSTDKAGNAGVIRTQLISVDMAAPTVSITAPANGSSFTQGTAVKITATATDLGTGSGAPSGIASVTFYLDGTTVIATVKSGTYTTNWSTKGVTKAKHNLTAVATDVAGNSTTSAAISVTIS